jgi:hypothetical protein
METDMTKNLIDFTDLEIARAVHRMDGASDYLEGSELRAWNLTRSMIISNCEQLRELDLEDKATEMKVSLAAALLAEKTKDAYSAYAFEADNEWSKAAQMLLDREYSEIEAERILRSKFTRWCRDSFSAHDEGKAEYLAKFLDTLTEQQIAQVTRS